MDEFQIKLAKYLLTLAAYKLSSSNIIEGYMKFW